MLGALFAVVITETPRRNAREASLGPSRLQLNVSHFVFRCVCALVFERKHACLAICGRKKERNRFSVETSRFISVLSKCI